MQHSGHSARIGNINRRMRIAAALTRIYEDSVWRRPAIANHKLEDLVIACSTKSKDSGPSSCEPENVDALKPPVRLAQLVSQTNSMRQRIQNAPSVAILGGEPLVSFR